MESTKGLISGDQERLTQCIRLLIEATIDSTRRGHTIDVETTFDHSKGLTLRVISPTSPKRDEQPNDERILGSSGQGGLMKGMALISAIIHAHGGTVATLEEGARRYVTQIDLPTEGAIEKPAKPV